MKRILSQLYSQPLMIEGNAWRAFEENARASAVVSPPLPVAARLCGCDSPIPEPTPRYLNVLELRRLSADLSQSFNADMAMPNDTAIITVEGLIVKHAEEWECEFLGLTDLDDVDAALAQVAADANIRNLFLNFVNCPGGSVVGLPETAARVAALALVKNVIAFSDSQCTSAGVYIASQASEFFVTESTYSGSIGIIRPPIIDISEQLKANGVKATIIKSGKFKDTGTMLRPITPEEVAMLQATSDRIMGMFTAAVKSGRPKMSADNMQGQIFFGREAVEVGLADAVVADMNEALAAF
jgi:signal peptide peptidase SppA